MKTRTLLLTLAAGLSAGTLFAQQQEAPQPPDRPDGPPQHAPLGMMALVRAVDTDHDGILSGAEMAAAPESLKALDQDSDGALSPREYFAPPMPPQQQGADKERLRRNNQTRPSPSQLNNTRRNEAENRPPRRPGRPHAPLGILWALDGDGDHTISAAELAASPESLKSLDREADGQLGPREYGPLPPPLFWAIDANLNGILSSEEIAGAADSLKVLDSDADGQITETEFRPLLPPRPEKEARIGSRNANADQRPDRPNPPLESALDADNDNTISAAELASAPASLATLDKNGDGQLGPGEVMPHPELPMVKGDKRDRGNKRDREVRRQASGTDEQPMPPAGGPRGPRGGPGPR